MKPDDVPLVTVAAMGFERTVPERSRATTKMRCDPGVRGVYRMRKPALPATRSRSDCPTRSTFIGTPKKAGMRSVAPSAVVTSASTAVWSGSNGLS